MAVFVLGVGMRAYVHFSHTLPPGVDAAYYPLQTRTLLEQGRLMYNDLPLIFVIDAVVAKVLMLLGGMEIASACLLASQIVDCVSLPLAGFAIVGLGYAFGGGRVRAMPGAVAAALLATVSLPPMRMVSDFEKNSLGLALLAGAIWAVRGAMTADGGIGTRVRAWAWVGVFAVLVAVTHVGALGATVVVLSITMVSAWVMGGRITLRRAAMWSVGASAAAGVLLGAVALADMDRARHLVGVPMKLVQRPALSGLVRMVREGPRPRAPGMGPGVGPGMGGPPPRFEGGPPDDGVESRPPQRPDGPDGPRDRPGGRGPGMMGPDGPGGGPGGGDPVSLFTLVGVYVVAPLSLVVLWRNRRTTARADAAVVIGAGVGAMVLACPLINGEYFMRFVLMAPVPASVALAYVLCGGVWTGSRRWWAWPLAGAGAALALVPIAFGTPMIMRVQVEDDAVEELRSLGKFTPEAQGAGHTLVVAPHGLQYWAGHFMHAAGRLDRMPDGAMEKYQRVLILQPRGGRMGGGGGPPGMGSATRRRGDGPAAGFGPPPDGPGGGGRMVQVPMGAKELFRGEHYILWEVPRPAASED